MKKIAFLFSGQGSQYVGMGAELIQKYPEVRQTFEEASDLLGMDIYSLCARSDLASLSRPVNNHVAIYTVGVAHFRAIMNKIPAITPHFLIGHSLGEYTALTCGGALSFSLGLKLVKERGRCMETLTQQKYRVISVLGIPSSEVKSMVEFENTKQLAVACYNGSTSSTVVGTRELVDRFESTLKKTGARIVDLNITVPVHSELMKSIAGEFSSHMDTLTFNPLNYQIISSVTSTPYQSNVDFSSNLKKQLWEPVQWQQCIDFLFEKNVFYFLEVGGSGNLTGLMNAYGREFMAPLRSKEEEDNFEVFLNGGVHLHNFIAKCLAISVTTRSNYEEISPNLQLALSNFQNLQQIDDTVRLENRPPNKEELLQVILGLKEILMAKEIRESQYVEYINSAILETGTFHLVADMIK